MDALLVPPRALDFNWSAPRMPSRAADVDRVRSESRTPGPAFDVVGQSRRLSAGQLLQADNGCHPGGFPTNYLNLASYLNGLFPGAILPSDSQGLEHISERLQSTANAPLTRLDLFDMVQDVKQQELTQSDDAETAPLPDDTALEQALLPIFVHAFAFQGDDGKPISVSSITVGPVGEDLSADALSDGNAADIASLLFLGHEDEPYDVAVTWNDGSSTVQQCDGSEAASEDVDVYIPW